MNEREMFLEALDIQDPLARASYVHRQCAEDEPMRLRLESLLAAHGMASGFLESPPAAIVALAESRVEKPGAQIGPYKLVELVGEGGMGLVYLAEQLLPIQRRVALKIVKPGMDTRQVIARFEAERQALAMMDHPNIARVLDAGATESGRPYFVMELVHGVPITEFCSQHQLSVDERLHLFVQVCRGVQHAHQKGIIHRDIKPSNVLVATHDQVAVPKVIDFGVAKATAQQLSDSTLTNFAQLIGTPLYMSPEQAEMSGLDVDTRSDIYSLGVLLYELLTGGTPFNREKLKAIPYDEVRRIIREDEPLRPSVFVDTRAHPQTQTTINTDRKAEVRGVSQRLRGDLDWIVMKALEKDRLRRYESVSGLARDIERHLVHEPVEARPPLATYRFQKFARRHRVGMISALLLGAVLAAGLLTSTWQAIRATRAEHNADAAHLAEAEQRRLAEIERNEAQRQRARAEANFRSALESAEDYSTAVTDDVRLQSPALQPLRMELLNSSLNYYRRFIEQYREDAAVKVEIADAYQRVGEISKATGADQAAEAALTEARDRYEMLAQEQPPLEVHLAALARIYFDLGAVQRALLRLDVAETSDAKAIDLFERLAVDFPDLAGYRLDAARTRIDLGVTQSALGKNNEAATSLQSAIETLDTLAITHSEEIIQRSVRPELARAHFHLGALHRATGRDNEAQAPLVRACELFGQLVEEQPSVMTYRGNLARACSALAAAFRAAGRPKDAEEYLIKCLDLYRRVTAEEPTVAEYRMGLGWANFRLGCHQRATGDGDAAVQSWIAATIAFDEALALGYRADQVYKGLGDAFAMLGNWQQAADAYRHVAEASGLAPTQLFQWAVLQLAAGDEAGYRAACHELVARHAASAGGMQAFFIVMICVAGDDAVDDMSPVVALAERLIALNPGNPVLQALLASAQFRAGDADSAVEALKKSLPMHVMAELAAPMKRDPIRASRLAGETILALGYRQHGDGETLANQLRQLRRVVDKIESSQPQFSEGVSEWTLPLAIHLARRELVRLESTTNVP